MNLHGRSLLTLLDFEPSEVHVLLDLAATLKREKKARIFPKRLANRNIALIFEKRSTRTRCAFVCAASDEGAHAECLAPEDIHLGKKESIEDTARVLGRMFDGIQFRGFAQSTVDALAQHSGVPVWNGLTDDHHPTQALADALTLVEKFGSLQNKKMVYLGDGANNVAHSLMVVSAQLGMHFVCASPEHLRPRADLIAKCEEIGRKTGGRLEFTTHVKAAVHKADCLYTDVWISMGQENAPDVAERLELLKPYQVNAELMGATQKSDTVFLHCLPAVKGLEVSAEVFESAQSLVFEEAENRLHTIKAVMVATLGN